MVVAIGAGVVAGIGLYYTDRNFRQTRILFEHTRATDRRQAELTREGQVTERYAKAIEMLSSENLTMQLGGIYSLERIMRDSAKDHSTIVEVLAAFVRQHAAVKPEDEESSSALARHELPSHVQSALTVIGRRPGRDETTRIDLTGTDLRGARLRGARLDRAVLVDARLDGADLVQARLDNTILIGANLERASLRGARLDCAEMYRANLRGADLTDARADDAQITDADLEGARMVAARLDGVVFTGSQLNRANLSDANLRGATLLADFTATGLTGADLTNSYGLQATTLEMASIDAKTRLPPDIAADPRIREKIENWEEEAAASEYDPDDHPRPSWPTRELHDE